MKEAFQTERVISQDRATNLHTENGKPGMFYLVGSEKRNPGYAFPLLLLLQGLLFTVNTGIVWEMMSHTLNLTGGFLCTKVSQIPNQGGDVSGYRLVTAPHHITLSTSNIIQSNTII